jgi:hypothetical protein
MLEIVSARAWSGNTAVPPAAEPARCLADLSVIALEAIASLAEPFEPKPGVAGPAVLLAKSRRGSFVFRPYCLRQGLRATGAP